MARTTSKHTPDTSREWRYYAVWTNGVTGHSTPQQQGPFSQYLRALQTCEQWMAWQDGEYKVVRLNAYGRVTVFHATRTNGTVTEHITPATAV